MVGEPFGVCMCIRAVFVQLHLCTTVTFCLTVHVCNPCLFATLVVTKAVEQDSWYLDGVVDANARFTLKSPPFATHRQAANKAHGMHGHVLSSSSGLREASPAAS